MIWIIAWIWFKSWAQAWRIQRLSSLLKTTENDLKTTTEKFEKSKSSIERYKKSYDELFQEYTRMYKRMTELNKKDNPRVLAEHFKDEIIDLYKKWIKVTVIAKRLWFSHSTVSKWLKKWWIR